MTRPLATENCSRARRLLLLFRTASFLFMTTCCLEIPGQSLQQLYPHAWLSKDGSPTSISALARSWDGRLCIGTSSNGLYSFDEKRFSPVTAQNPPGHYLFRVLATIGKGEWGPIEDPDVQVASAFYQNVRFKLLFLAGAFMVLWTVYRVRLRILTTRVEIRLEKRARERLRVARDLHDTLLQSIHGLTLRFHGATESLPENEPAREELFEALSKADKVILECRERVQSLHRSQPDDEDFAQQLSQVGHDLHWDPKTSLEVFSTGTPRSLLPEVRDELCHISREALANTFRHAKATKVEIEVQYEADRFAVMIRDDGAGIPEDVARSGGREGHFGFRGMRERATLVHATLDIVSCLGNGTEIRIVITGGKAYKQRPSGLKRFFGAALRGHPYGVD